MIARLDECPSLPAGQLRRVAGRRATLDDIAAAVGTPCLRLQRRRHPRRLPALDDAFGDYPHAIHYALKANSALAIVRLLHALGSPADANSLRRSGRRAALRLPSRPNRVHRRRQERRGDRSRRGAGLLAINVESPGELDRIDRLAPIAQGARRASRCASIPTSTRKSHPHISTGLKSNKFGVPIDEAPALFREMRRAPGLMPVGVHVHIGSQITTLDPLAARRRSRGGAGARAARTTASRSSTSTWAAASASPTKAAPVARSGGLRPRARRAPRAAAA